MHYSIILLHQRFYKCTLNDSKIFVALESNGKNLAARTYHVNRSTPTLKRLDKQKYTLVYTYTLLLITTASISINAFNGNELIPMVVRAGNGVSILQ